MICINCEVILIIIIFFWSFHQIQAHQFTSNLNSDHFVLENFINNLVKEYEDRLEPAGMILSDVQNNVKLEISEKIKDFLETNTPENQQILRNRRSTYASKSLDSGKFNYFI